MISDRCSDILSYIAKCDEMILISPVLFGSYLESIKAVIDRSIPYILPYLRIVDGEMHHKMRYKHSFKQGKYKGFAKMINRNLWR